MANPQPKFHIVTTDGKHSRLTRLPVTRATAERQLPGLALLYCLNRGRYAVASRGSTPTVNLFNQSNNHIGTVEVWAESAGSIIEYTPAFITVLPERSGM